MDIKLKEVDKIEILTLQDNYIDLVSRDNSEIVQRALPIKDGVAKSSVLAEHGFSSIFTVTAGSQTRSILFDFGYSEHGAAFNSEALDADLESIEIMALSHGHLDHVGGMGELVSKIGKKDLKLVLHPAAFRNPRFLKIADNRKIILPSLNRKKIENFGVTPVETKEPYALLDGAVYFLGEIPRKTDFEKGAASLCYEENGVEKQDPINDDSSLVAHLKGKGLIILSGCAHAGIINTINYAKETSGIKHVHAVMGGFHLTGAEFEAIIEPTVNNLKEINPDYIIPTHCTGRKSILAIENEMPDKFIMNMSGTKMTFAS